MGEQLYVLGNVVTDRQGYEPTWIAAQALYGNAAHYGYEAKKLDAPEPAPKTTYPAATGGTTYPVAR